MSTGRRGSGTPSPQPSPGERESQAAGLLPGEVALAAEVYGLPPEATGAAVVSAVVAGPAPIIHAYAQEHTAARTDAMTGLLNKKAFFERFMGSSPEDMDDIVALFLVDVDAFKKLNDLAGYSEGDRLLIELAKKLRPDDESYRLGGDEYALVIRRGDLRSSDPEISPEELVVKLQERLVAEARRMFAEEFAGHPGLDVSFGLALVADLRNELGNNLTPQHMFAAANRALKLVKAANEAEAQRQATMRVRFYRAVGRTAFKLSGDYDSRTMP